MTPAARVAAAIDVLDNIAAGRTAEQALSNWARASRFAGSKDRAALRDLVFDALRMRASSAAHGGGLEGRALMIGQAVQSGWDLDAVFSGEGHAPAPLTPAELETLARPRTLTDAQAHDLPEWLWAQFQEDLGAEASAAALALRERAPLYLRVAQSRGSVADAIASLAREEIDVTPHEVQDGCLRVVSNPRRVKTSTAYSDGCVEIQDAASQIAVAQLDIPNEARVLDFCAGGGGKSLALADRFDCTVTAHDVSAARMQDIAPRAARAGVQIAVATTAELSGSQFDVVVVDAPCSGSGTWRRNPEAKWALTPEKLMEFQALQTDVVAQAATHVRPGGTLVYMTCSVLQAENEGVIEAVLQAQPAWQAEPALKLLPTGQSDGFFCKILRTGAPA